MAGEGACPLPWLRGCGAMESLDIAVLMAAARAGQQGAEQRYQLRHGMQKRMHQKKHGGGPRGYPGFGDAPIFWVRMVIRGV